MGYIPWQEKAVQTGYNIRWECESGAIFGKARKPEVLYYLWDLWGNLAANAVRFGSGNAPTAGSFSPYAIPQDNFVPPRKIFFHNRPCHFIQVFPGLNHPDLYYFLRIPQGQPVGGHIGYLGYPDSNFRYSYGWWFQGKDSDIDSPSDAGEFWVPPGIDVEHAVVNGINERVRAQAMFVMNQFEFYPYDPSTPLGQRAILNILRGNVPCSDGTVGGRKNFSIPESSFRQMFKVQPVTFDGAKAYMVKDGKEIAIGEV